jgi:hypothetical protein
MDPEGETSPKADGCPKEETMTDLSSQIETLYRVIGQIRPESGTGDQPAQQEPSPSRPAPEARAQSRASLRPASRTASVRWIFTFYCFWFSLPLSVWFSSGWIGLFFYWRALAGTARLIELLHNLPAAFSPSSIFRATSFRGAPMRRKRPEPHRHRGFTSTPFQLGAFQLSPFPLSPLETDALNSRLADSVPVLSLYGGARCSAIELEAQ